jgi:cation diffusion facilitator CzcD-associated flavoprotein CzcO
MALSDLEALARHELAQLNYPANNWVLPREGLLDVFVVGGGMCGQTASFALLREGVRNLRCVDRAPRRREGPWSTFARMDILRSPKHLTGPDLGVAALTYRAWHEAKYGIEHWQQLHKILRLDWAEYLMWVRETAEIPVENEQEVFAVTPHADFVAVKLKSQVVRCRKVVLAMGREGSGAPRWPFKNKPEGVYHSADDIDFAALKGKRIGVLGAGASAFDNAAEALEAGATQVVMFARRPHLPQVNKSKWASFPGFQHGYAHLDDASRWRFYTYILSEQVPPPYESVLRCEKHVGFSIRFSAGWKDIARDTFDAVIVATGFDVNLLDRPEVAPFRDAIETWRSHVPPAEAEKFPEEARFPYLGDAFQLKGNAPGIGRVHVFNWGSTMSHGALAGDIPGIETGVRRLVSGIVRDLFVEDADRYWERVQMHNEDELKPTRYFVSLSSRRRP